MYAKKKKKPKRRSIDPKAYVSNAQTLEINGSPKHTDLTHARTHALEINRSPKIHAEHIGDQSITRAYIYNTRMHAEGIGDQSITRGYWGLLHFFFECGESLHLSLCYNGWEDQGGK
ncbi:hypothetical protein F0562_021609 [Nyssa sinensis]|uniref:Uncharacterized protein n=1 Tax=Nyssa sinensis TaxID=561372 RepID=A0A5J5BKH2_9ASTE|nr:hypothetical protein F0562_021609 [Nyssa sinensis]